MARKEIMTLTDDLDGKPIETGGGETVRFSLRGVEYEIDLGAKNAEKLTKALQPYVDGGRRVGGRATRRSSGVSAGSDAAQLVAMREWARSNGYDVASRGRISKKIQDAYNAA